MAFFATKTAPGAPEQQCSGRTRLFAAICAFLLATLLVQHTGRMQRIGMVTHDDIGSELSAAEAKNGGFGIALKRAGEIARGQGRVGYYISYFLVIAPHLVESDNARGLLIAGVHFFSLAAACGFLSLYVGPAVGLLALTALYAFLPHWWQYFPVGSYPVVFDAAVLCFFTAAMLEIARIRLVLPRAGGWALRVFSAVLLVISLSVYEASAVMFATLLALVLACEWRRAPAERRRNVAGSAGFLLGLFLLAAGVYAAFRILHPSGYEGNQFSAGSLLNLRAVAAAATAYALGGLPLAPLYFQPGIVSRFSTDAMAEIGGLAFLARSLTLTAAIQAALFGGAVAGFLRAGVPARHRRAALILASSACFLAFVVALPIAVTARYQQDPWMRAPHVPGYFAYLCWMTALAGALAFASTFQPRAAKLPVAAASVAAGAMAFLGAAVAQVSNDAVVRSQESHYATWRLIRLFLRSEAFAAVPANAVVVAPTLWDALDPAWPHYEGYWQKYFYAHTRHRVHVVRKLPHEGAAYYLEIQQARDLGRPVLLLQRLTTRSTAEWTLVLAVHDVKRAALRYLADEGAAPKQHKPVGSLETVPLPPCRYRRGAYITAAPSPELIAGTATVESIQATEPGKYLRD